MSRRIHRRVVRLVGHVARYGDDERDNDDNENNDHDQVNNKNCVETVRQQSETI